MSPQFRLAWVCSLLAVGPLIAAPPRALPEGSLPDDRRLAPPKDLNGYFPFQVPASVAAWTPRQERVRRQLLVALGLDPLPTRTPLNPVVHSRRDQGDYTVENVYFESVPGFFVTGNLYRPKGAAGRHPAVLCPHGHWKDGRFMDQGVETVRREIANGAERFENGGRSVLQARCVTLARMGCVVFHYDMLGYADSQQLSMELVHGFAKQRPAMNDPEHWGFFTPQAEARFQSVMGLQAWNSIRALDFLETLPDVDTARIGVTGASGGGTQTFILGAIDPRPTAAFPAVMVSTAMQGGCTCENASGLRVGTGNVEIAALFAPKPLGMTGANDWTLEMPAKGYPELQRLYELLGAKDRVMLKHLPHFDHNYNYVSRSAMYGWFNKHLGLRRPEPIVEEDYPRLEAKDLSVWNNEHPRPPGGDEFERRLIGWLTEDSRQKFAALAANPAARDQALGPSLAVVVGRTLAEVGKVEWEQKAKTDRGTYLEMVGVLKAVDQGEVVPTLFLHPKNANQTTVLLPTPNGKEGLFEVDGTPRAEVRRFLEAGTTVVGMDLLYQGESLAGGKVLTETPRVKNPREAAAYTFGYNHSVFQMRVHDLLTVISFVRHHEKAPQTLRLVAHPGAGHWAACAKAVSGDALRDCAIEVGDFRFAKLKEIQHPDFVPGGAKYLDPFVLDHP